MKKVIILSAFVGLFLSSCSITHPFAFTNNPIGEKIGKSSTVCLFSGKGLGSKNGMYNGIMLNKNFGIVEAAKNGGITKIGAVDMKQTNYFIFIKREFIVAGE